MSPPNPTLDHYPDLHTRDVLLLVLIFFPPFSAAAPIRDSSTSSTWLACLAALLIFSAICLSAFKFLFVRHRKTSNLKGPPSAYIHGQYVHRNFNFLKFPAYTACKSSKICKAGFIIGLFGSPSFETRSKPNELTLIYPGGDTSKSSQKHDLSGDTTTTFNTKSSAFSTGPVVLFSEKPPWSVHRHGNKHSPSSLTKSTKSRFLLPSQLWFDLSRIGRKKKPLQADVSVPQDGLPWPHNYLEHATLRLVKLYTEPEASLPFCKGAEAVPDLSPLARPAHSFAIAYLNRPHPLPISPLPLLPTRDANDEERMPKTLPPETIVDHPYNNALLNLTKPGRQNSRRASLSPNLSVIEEACHAPLLYLPPVFGPGYQLTSDPICEQGRLVPLPSGDTTKSPPLAFSAYETLKRREKLRSSSLRNRRSPPLGPSPLRSMTLPDIAEDDFPHLKHTIVDEVADYPVPKRKSLQYQNIGLGLPSIKLSPPNKERMTSQDSNGNASAGTRESMLDLLRELAEETREWDESIVLDEGFKSMIQRSQVILGCTSLENVNVKCSAPKVSLGPGNRNKTPPRFVSFWLEDSPSP